jgi:hypothetical protein
MDEEYEKIMREGDAFDANTKALDAALLEFRLWYKQYYLHFDRKKHNRDRFKQEVERHLRRIKDLELKTDVYYYTEMMDIMTPESLKHMF